MSYCVRILACPNNQNYISYFYLFVKSEICPAPYDWVVYNIKNSKNNKTKSNVYPEEKTFRLTK